ncbi:MAG: glycosyltransferase family 2 protein [Bacteroidales bacterium]|nr:glycosyltransferase family 2 protein [Bacteroidales bacterium]
MKKISILIPCYNEQESLPLLYKALNEAMADSRVAGRYEFEVMLVNDGSSDSTLAILRQLHKEDSRVSYIDLSRNFGKENAMMAGFDYVTGDCCIIMDADLQDPPQVMFEMIEKWEEGYEDVYAKRISRGKESWLRKKLSMKFYKILNKMSKVEMLQNVGDFRLLDKRCVEALKSLRETERYTKGLFCWIGYRKAEVLFDRGDRVAGTTSWSMWKLMRLGIDGIISFTTAPLHLATWLGIIISFFAFIYLVFVLLKTLIFGDPVAGFPTLICVILFLGGVILLCLGILGEYVARMYSETKRRPGYIVREFNDKLV